VNADRLADLLDAISRVRLAVVGDYFLDRYGRGRVSGVSRETGHRVTRLSEHTFRPGGTGNVAANAAALGAHVAAVGVLGADRYAEIYRADLGDRGINASHLATDPCRNTPAFEKFLIERPDGDVRELRVDVDNETPVSADATQQMCEAIDALAGKVDGLVVADYEECGAGAITSAVLDRLLAVARAGRIPCLVMSRTRMTDFLPLAPVQNEYEVVTQMGVSEPGIFDPVPDAEVVRGAAALLGAGAPAVYVTRGRRGISVFESDGGRTLVRTRPAPEPVDTCGAGDTVLAAVAGALAAGGTPVEAAFLANVAASVTVRQLGTTGTASPAEVREAFAAVAAADGES